MAEKSVGVLGGTSLVGDALLPILAKEAWRGVAFTRQGGHRGADQLSWRRLDPAEGGAALCAGGEQIPCWISLMPIRALPDYFARLEACGARRVVALSSTSRFTKAESSDLGEIELVRELSEGEERLREWGEQKGVEWVILRPTLIYGLGRDRNIFEIASFIRRFRFFPLFGRATGLRQPVFAGDVAAACLTALTAPQATNRAYNLSGGEALSYRQMVGRVFQALGFRPLMPRVPLVLFRLAVAGLRWLPRYRNWTAVMAERMNKDMIFDHAEARRDLGYYPRMFQLTAGDLPGQGR